MAVHTRKTASRDHLKKERTKLQGAWNSVSGRRPAQLLIAGSSFMFRFQDSSSEIYVGTFELALTGKPRGIDMHIDEGPARHKGKTARCVYELVGERLRWCPVEPGKDHRLTAFPAEDDAKYLCTVFEREEA